MNAPWWVRLAARVIPRLPAGRFRAASLVSARACPPFVAAMPGAIGGARFWCDLRDDLARDVCLTGQYEPQVTAVLTALVQPGMVVVDVGANWGYFTLVAASLVGATGRVLALEPDPRAFAVLERNLALNGFHHIVAVQAAAGRTEAALALEGYHDAARNRGVSRVRDTATASRGPTFTIHAARLDDLLRREALSAIDLVKVDVEGSEDAVLEGMREGLGAGRYRRILIELHPALLAERDLTVDDCCAILRDHGYEGWTFDHAPAAVRRAAYATSSTLSDLLRRSDRVAPEDPWPHMLWIAPHSQLLDSPRRQGWGLTKGLTGIMNDDA